jgi:polyphosphate kinase
MFPIEAPNLKRRILTEVIPTYLGDNVKSRLLLPEGNYVRIQPGGAPHRSQEEFLAMRPATAEPIAEDGAENGIGSGARHTLAAAFKLPAP